jgi:hypothetical protein
MRRLKKDESNGARALELPPGRARPHGKGPENVEEEEEEEEDEEEEAAGGRYDDKK